MIDARAFVEAASQRGFQFFTAVPCSYFTPLINYVTHAVSITYIGAANEGDAVAIATGATLAGRRAVVMMQNSGLGNAVNPLTSLCATFDLPVVLVVTWRAEPGTSDEPQHQLMGSITPKLLDLMGIESELFPSEANRIPDAIDRAVAAMDRTRRPYALIMRKDSVAPYPLTPSAAVAPMISRPPTRADEQTVLADRLALLRAVVAETPVARSVLVATTGYTGRELYTVDDRPNHFYMVGSMGCALPLALGLALTLPDKRIVVLDGDGALLMRMGAMATVGYYRPPNLSHVLFDNGVHLSTGAQPTVSDAVDFCGIAAASGYQRVLEGSSMAILKQALASDGGSGPTFVRMRVTAGVVDKLPRPRVSPVEVAARLQAHLGNGA